MLIILSANSSVNLSESYRCLSCIISHTWWLDWGTWFQAHGPQGRWQESAKQKITLISSFYRYYNNGCAKKLCILYNSFLFLIFFLCYTMNRFLWEKFALCSDFMSADVGYSRLFSGITLNSLTGTGPPAGNQRRRAPMTMNNTLNIYERSVSSCKYSVSSI